MSSGLLGTLLYMTDEHADFKAHHGKNQSRGLWLFYDEIRLLNPESVGVEISVVRMLSIL